jgi:predicted ester cyclase
MGTMVDVVERIMALWQHVPEDEAEARSAFAETYADKVLVNGAELTLPDLVARARSLQAALGDLHHEMIERVETDDKLVIAFRLRGRHIGPLGTALGDVSATGRDVTIQGMDVLTFTDGRISEITVLSDELGLLRQLDAVALRQA